MYQNQKPQRQNSELDPDLIKDFLRHQQQQIQLEERRLALEEKRLSQDGKLAEKSMDINGQLLKDAPSQQRKTIITIGVIGSILILGFLLFLSYCINNGKEDFIKSFLGWVSHLFTIALGFWVGRSTAKKNKSGNRDNDGIADAEVVD